MPYKFYHFEASAPSRTVMLTLRQLGIEADTKILNLFAGEHLKDEEFMDLNPSHQVPTLVDEKFVLTESRAIATYLCNLEEEETNLYPEDPQKRALIDSKLYYDATCLSIRIGEAVRPVISGQTRKIPQEKKDKIEESMVYLEGLLEGKFWFVGPFVTLADLAFLAIIATIYECGYDLNKHPNLSAWYDRCRSLPGFGENEEGAKKFAGALDNKLEEPY